MITEISVAASLVFGMIGWYCGNSNRKTHPVAEKNPNVSGLGIIK